MSEDIHVLLDHVSGNERASFHTLGDLAAETPSAQRGL